MMAQTPAEIQPGRTALLYRAALLVANTPDLIRLLEQMTALEQLRHLLIRLSEHWSRYRVFDWQPDVPWTNNGTEQVIGRMKVRSKSVRGYKTESGMLAGLMLSGSGVI